MEDMTINADDSFDDFAAAFDDTDGYQTGDDSGAEDTENAETGIDDVDGEGQEDVTGEGTGGDTEAASGETEPSGGAADGTESAQEQSFTIRVNKQDVTLSRDDMIAYAQKGADYDRVKGQLTESRQQNQTLQEQLGKYQNAIEVLEAVSADSGMSVDELVEQVHVNMLTKQGKTEAEAKAEIRAQKAERERDALKARTEEQKNPPAEDSQARAGREVAEFRQRFPDVELTEELCNDLMTDVQGGMPLVDAYQKYENARKDAQIEELQRQLAAEKQNKRNRTSTPGSQNDSGGRRVKNDFNDFERGLFG